MKADEVPVVEERKRQVQLQLCVLTPAFWENHFRQIEILASGYSICLWH